MSNINIEFCRIVLAETMKLITPLTTVEQRKGVWVYKLMDEHWEFHGPQGFYWHGSADNAHDVRAKGWNAWLSKYYEERARGFAFFRQWSVLEYKCERCGERLNKQTKVDLELSCSTGRYHKSGIPAGEVSQGWFSFGAACARAVLRANGDNRKIRSALR